MADAAYSRLVEGEEIIIGAEETSNNINGGYIKKSERPKEPWKGVYAKSILYAGLDAIVTCFSLISSISASRISSVDVLVLGFANLVADGISMGFGDFMSSSSEKDVAAKERAVTNGMSLITVALRSWWSCFGDIKHLGWMLTTLLRYARSSSRT
ncbi:uncharacterized protein Pyn_36989 [Prunus yedoensis var. nudiflora]|uniref:Vacuolar iron transporter n=1 Tax=Prunus yedoensis var. nudiflora TaxID=2094558 RepID=A0A314XNG3_PRUYE|nr:uncharacterized protein Pyn_36989 [Prunus yedoensis var. nudiflora]